MGRHSSTRPRSNLSILKEGGPKGEVSSSNVRRNLRTGKSLCAHELARVATYTVQTQDSILRHEVYGVYIHLCAVCHPWVGGSPLLYPGSVHAGSEEALLGLPGVLANTGFLPLDKQENEAVWQRATRPKYITCMPIVLIVA